MSLYLVSLDHTPASIYSNTHPDSCSVILNLEQFQATLFDSHLNVRGLGIQTINIALYVISNYLKYNRETVRWKGTTVDINVD